MPVCEGYAFSESGSTPPPVTVAPVVRFDVERPNESWCFRDTGGDAVTKQLEAEAAGGRCTALVMLHPLAYPSPPRLPLTPSPTPHPLAMPHTRTRCICCTPSPSTELHLHLLLPLAKLHLLHPLTSSPSCIPSPIPWLHLHPHLPRCCTHPHDQLHPLTTSHTPS